MPGELHKKFVFDHTKKWHMCNLESVLENDTRKFLWDFDLISVRRPNILIINKKENKPNIGLCNPGWSQSKTERERQKYSNFARESKKLRNMEVAIITFVIGALGTVTKGLIKGLGNKRTSGDHTIYCIIEIGQNREESWRLEGTCCNSNVSAHVDVKNRRSK